MKRASTRGITWLFFVTRLILVIVTYFAYILLTAPKYSSTPVNTAALFTSWDHWDAANYTRIAQHGYQIPHYTAFFPLFPFLIAVFTHLIGNREYLLIGMLISNGALLGALFVIYQLATDMLGEQIGRRTVLYLCIFPTAFFFFTAYNESLFLLLTTGALLAMRRQHWWVAGILGLLASLTRSAGVFLIFPYMYELWMIRANIIVPEKDRLHNFSSMLLKTLPILLIPLGILIYCIYCWQAFHDPLIFIRIQSDWNRQVSWPWQGIRQALFELFWNQPFGSFYEAHIILDLGATIGFIVLAILGWRILRTSYSLWIGVLLVYMLISSAAVAHDALVSNQRFVLEMFPAFITLANLSMKYPRLHQVLLLLFPALQVTLSILFIMNRWMI